MKRYGLVVIGGGPGGYVAAIRAHQMGMKVAVVEKDRVGGICLNWGCIPSKSLLRDAELFRLVQQGKGLGFTCDGVRADLKRVVARSRSVSSRLVKGIEALLKKSGIPIHPGTAAVTAPGKVSVQGKAGGKPEVLETERILVATGAAPISIPGLPIDRERIVTSTEAMLLEEVPERVVIVGGGAIGVEFAYYFNAFGSLVTIIEMMPRIIPQEDPEVTDTLTQSLEKQGIEILTGSRVESAQILKKREVALQVKTPKETRTISADRVLVAAGVRPNSAGMGLEKLGVRIEKGFIRVDGNYRTGAASIHAVGDVIGPPFLAHVASAEGIAAVEAMAGKPGKPINYNAVPRCVYCQPQVASVGMTEEEARKKGHTVRVGKFPFRANGRALAAGNHEGFVKILVDAKYGEILGAQVIGHEASEQIAELCLAINLEATPEEILNTVHAHPTLSEAVMEAAAAAVERAIHI